MRLEVKVKTGANEEKVEEGEPLRVWVKASPRKGKANRALLKVLSDHFSVPTSHVRILRGHRSSRKFIEILTRDI